MHELRWTATAATDGDTPCTVMAVHAGLLAGVDPAPLRTWVRRLEPVLATTNDLLGYASRVTAHDLLVVSAWTRRASLAAFDRCSAHRQAKAELRHLLRPAVLAVWTTSSTALPVESPEVWQRLTAASRGAATPDART